VACGDQAGTRRELARHPGAINEVFYEFNAVGYAIHSWQPETLRILLDHGGRLSDLDREHILRITKGNQKFLDGLIAIT
jgi:hypothetical protein